MHCFVMKQDLLYLRHTGSYTPLRRHIATSVVVGFSRLKGRHASWLPSIQIRFVITQAEQVHDQSAVIMQGMAALTVADSGCLFRLRFGFVCASVFLFSVQSFSSETGGRRSHHCLGFSTESGILLPRNGYISLSPTLQALACASALQWVYYGRISVHRRTI